MRNPLDTLDCAERADYISRSIKAKTYEQISGVTRVTR
ncbi:hypothetical protein MA5S0422_0559 [Mycobacteroides abscessus 5S-0422]|uniref:Uncharacterized protein n=1 Tax=Mycobacteroides abscessus subsp. bolletii 1513 TaxID=1299321 RepID=X8E273_9MYCO|nr:hypothetical protein MA5S0421_5390 [Mycobacteroides abscessus 5S-0421]EIU12175.1 hypothetical protein MA5S0304_5153 [Mycobacteroides abscessus 5S-0304]EIU19222.1 hypothetical protein MA5S0422_0559 [Mycobacteroides abscessus 5S-0422]EIU24893.1 hypothetical protein MA5S0817_4706 [Mycobacteroides abscessus 5S-0817]EIU34072.1 hypothetical protein MA5S0708_0468 [Mycobacteroides abscessus 5S-0708]EIU35779.1 hypothetical protein MA5S1212_0141 [Mycobacteroides abscessus 5S-1212]EIU41625.1 hypothet